MFDLSIGLSRRSFVTTVGSVTALSLAGCVEDDASDRETSTPERDGNETEADGGSGDGGDSERDDQELSGEIQITGSRTVFPLMNGVAEQFRDEHDGVGITVQLTGSEGGFRNFFCTGDAQFHTASRPIQAGICDESGTDWIELTVATSAVAVVVSGENDFLGDPPCLTVEELTRIWERDAAGTWDEIRDGFPNQPIDRYGPAEPTGTYDFFTETIGPDGGHTDEYTATGHQNQIARSVQGSEYAIGYMGLPYYSQTQDQVRAVAIDDGNGCVSPSRDAVATGGYQPLSRELYAYVNTAALADDHVASFARHLVEQTTSKELVAEEVGCVPLTGSQQEEQMGRLEAAIEEAG